MVLLTVSSVAAIAALVGLARSMRRHAAEEDEITVVGTIWISIDPSNATSEDKEDACTTSRTP